MKKLLPILAAMVWTNFVQSQSDSLFTFSGVVQLDTSLPADKIYSRARQWFNENFRSGKVVIQIDDKEAGEISGKGSFEHSMIFIEGINYGTGAVEFICTINVKQGKYKYIISDFRHFSSDPRYDSYGLITKATESPSGFRVGKKMATKQWNVLQNAILTKGDALVKSLNDYMAKATTADSW